MLPPPSVSPDSRFTPSSNTACVTLGRRPGLPDTVFSKGKCDGNHTFLTGPPEDSVSCDSQHCSHHHPSWEEPGTSTLKFPSSPSPIMTLWGLHNRLIICSFARGRNRGPKRAAMCPGPHKKGWLLPHLEALSHLPSPHTPTPPLSRVPSSGVCGCPHSHPGSAMVGGGQGVFGDLVEQHLFVPAPLEFLLHMPGFVSDQRHHLPHDPPRKLPAQNPLFLHSGSGHPRCHL